MSGDFQFSGLYEFFRTSKEIEKVVCQVVKKFDDDVKLVVEMHQAGKLSSIEMSSKISKMADRPEMQEAEKIYINMIDSLNKMKSFINANDQKIVDELLDNLEDKEK